VSERKLIHAIPEARLRCDACGHQEPVDALDEKHIGRACPECGANMLTRDDFEAAKAIMATIDAINAFAGALGIGTETPSADAKRMVVNHHNGRTTVDWPA
jgi:hypothetical protein